MKHDKKIDFLSRRLQYIRDIFGDNENDSILLLESELEVCRRLLSSGGKSVEQSLAHLEDLFSFLESKLEKQLKPMDLVRIVRHPQRICLTDILENVYDNYTELGGLGEYSIDPAMLIAQAYISRKVGKKVINQPVMVIGHEKGHGEEFRNGGSAKPWGNAKALHYMKVAQEEGIPIHTYVFTPGSYPVEDYPGAAQQIAKNLYEISKIDVPIIAVFSEGGSGGAEAIGLADRRLMLSHGYYSVISPEGAAAIEGRLRGGERVAPELVERCASRLKITAGDNYRMGYIDRIISEPDLGARPYNYDFFRSLRSEVIRATNEVCASVRGMKLFRAMALRRKTTGEGEDVFMRWDLSRSSRSRLLEQRHEKYRHMAQEAYVDNRSLFIKAGSALQGLAWSTKSLVLYDLFGKVIKFARRGMEDIQAEARFVKDSTCRWFNVNGESKPEKGKISTDIREKLLKLSNPAKGVVLSEGIWRYCSPQARDDRTVSCPNAEKEGCLDLWAPDLYGDFAGVCSHCGHHFSMEYQWYLYNVFNYGDSFEFNSEIESGNPLNYEGFTLKVNEAHKKTRRRSACITFETRIEGINTVVACLTAPFRGGSVGAAEGEKFIRAVERAQRKQYPLIAYVHGTAGIRIQEGTNGVIQMPRCTMAVRRYTDSGGLYLVIYDTNSYAGPVASFLGCSPYQFGIRSSNIGFAGPGVITETTGITVPPGYHSAWQALSRGHIQGIWDRREMKKNIHQSLLTMGGGNLYYR